MPKNLTPNHFDYAGVYVEGQRSIFPFKKPHQASFMSGMLVPFGDPIPCFPGVKFDLKANAVIRSNTLVVPPLDPIFIDFITVWVPDRIVWTHQPQFIGENDTTAWTQTDQYIKPNVELSDINDPLAVDFISGTTFSDVDIANLFLSCHYGLFYGEGLATEQDGSAMDSPMPSASKKINVLSYRGYYFLWNQLFRDENYQRPVLFSKGDTGSNGEFGYFLRNYRCGGNSNIVTGGFTLGQGQPIEYATLMPVNKFHDWATSVLPQAQYGDGVELAGLTGYAPLKTNGNTLVSLLTETSNAPMIFGDVNLTKPDGSRVLSAGSVGVNFRTSNPTGDLGAYVESTNLVADLSEATAITVNQFRASVMFQRYLEALARGGRRVPEYYETIYSVKNTSARKDYPVVLSRHRFMLGVNQVVATADGSGEGWTSHLGDTGAYSLTNLRDISLCERDFDEFGYIHVLYCVRTGNRYSQMIQPHFLKISLLDEYNPFFDHIGEVALDNTTVNVLASTEGAFGYQEAWFDERTQIGMAVGSVNKKYGSLKYWVLGEVFDANLTVCSPGYLTFDPSIFDDVMVSNYSAYPQFIFDGLIHGRAVKRMSAHSIPGITGRI